MTEEKKGTFFYPSMASEEEIKEHEAGKRKMTGGEIYNEILNDPDLKPGDRLLSFPKMEAQRQAEAEKLKGTVDISKLNKGVTFDYPSLENPEEKKTGDERVDHLLSLVEEDRLVELGDEIRSDLIEMGASEKDLGMIDYMQELVKTSDNRELRDWCSEFVCWIYQTKKK